MQVYFCAPHPQLKIWYYSPRSWYFFFRNPNLPPRTHAGRCRVFFFNSVWFQTGCHIECKILQNICSFWPSPAPDRPMMHPMKPRNPDRRPPEVWPFTRIIASGQWRGFFSASKWKFAHSFGWLLPPECCQRGMGVVRGPWPFEVVMCIFIELSFWDDSLGVRFWPKLSSPECPWVPV